MTETTIHFLRDIFGGSAAAETVKVPHREGVSALQVVAPHLADYFEPSTRIAISVNGRRLTNDECTQPLPRPADVVVAPDPDQGFVVQLLVSLIVSAIVSYVAYLLSPTPDLPGVPQERGDETSPTGSWDAIQSSYRAGFPIPIIAGEHDTGGQVIFTKVRATGAGGAEVLTVIIAFAEGRCEAIGGVTGTQGEANALGGYSGSPTLSEGTLPANIRVNGNTFQAAAGQAAGIQAWLRMGETRQTALPKIPFGGVETTIAVNERFELGSGEISQRINDSRELSELYITIGFPAGLYQSVAGGIAPYPGPPASSTIPSPFPPFQPITATRMLAYLSIQPVGSATRTRIGPPGGSPFLEPTAPAFSWAMPMQPATVNPFGFTFPVPLPPGTTGPIDVHLKVGPLSNDPLVVATTEWRQLGYTLNKTFNYPNVCLMGLQLLSSRSTIGLRNTYTNRVKGLRCRVYDETIGGGAPSTSRYWELPPAGDAYNGIWSYPVGPNPAWFLAEFLTNQIALGEYVLRDEDIDWPQFRNWADRCDEDALVGAVNEALFQYDFVHDAPEKAWDIVLRICHAGRAAPVLNGTKFSVVYQYASAHGRGTNSVAAKASTQLITSGQVRAFQVDYFNTRARPGVLLAQLLNRDKNYAQDVITVEDPDGGFDDPSAVNPLGYTKETIQLFGIVRPSQARREMLFAHRVNRLVRSQVSFEIGPESLKSYLGDVISVQHDVLRPFDKESFAYRANATTSAASIEIDRPMTLAVATTYQVVIRDSSDTLQTRTVTQAAGSYGKGDTISLDATVSVKKGAPLAFGETAKVVKEYEIIELTLTEERLRRVRAIEWVPAVHTEPVVTDPEVKYGPDSEYHASTDVALRSDALGNDAVGIRVADQQLDGGRHRIAWRPPDARGRLEAEVWLRPEGASSWFYLGRTADTSIETRLTPGHRYEVSVAFHNQAGAHLNPDQAVTDAVVTAPEFPSLDVPECTNGEIAQRLDGLALAWDPVDALGIVGYEIRHSGWCGGRVVAQTKRPHVELVDVPFGNTGAGKFLVRARHESGLFSRRPLVLDSGTLTPYAHRSALVNQAPDPGVSGTLSNLASAAAELSIAAQHCSGTWESVEYAVGFDVEGLVLVYVEARGEDTGHLVGDMTYTVGSGEARWRTVAGRDASQWQPGVDDTVLVSDLTKKLGDMTVDEWNASPGINHNVRVEIRTCLTAETLATKSYEDAIAMRRTLGKVQVRLRLTRSNLDRQTYAKLFRVRVYA